MRLSPRDGYATREQVMLRTHRIDPRLSRGGAGRGDCSNPRFKVMMAQGYAEGYADGRMAQAGIAPVISQCNIRDDRNEKKSNSQLDLDGPQHGALRCASSANQMKGS